MSKNTNRAYLNKAEDGHSYKVLLLKELYPPYYDEAWSYHFPSLGPSWSNKWSKKAIFRHKYREYRTWKYNRKTQWK
jgi:hypothetical protein